MRVHVKFFAIFREMTGIKTEWREIAEGMTVEQLWKDYAARSPRVGSIRAAYAVNQHLVTSSQILRDGDEVGFLPPVSGGTPKPQRPQSAQRKSKKKISVSSVRSVSEDALVTRKPLDMNALVKRVAFPGAGAIITFSGVVRDNAQGKSVSHLEYDAYPEMAEGTMRDIITEIKMRWPDARVAMAHRVGRLKIGEASVIIAVAAPHRPEAYAASRYAIERVKAILPVWKKEFATDSQYWVEGPVAGEMPPDKAEKIVEEVERAATDTMTRRRGDGGTRG